MEESTATAPTSAPATAISRGKVWLQAIGPGLITAALVFGPSKITITSMMGARYGYSLLWLRLVAIFFMIVFAVMSARVGIATNESVLATIGRKWGKGMRTAVGVGVFLVCASFQAGNSIGTGIAIGEATHTSPNIWIIVFNVVAIGMLFFRSFYKSMEKIMIALIALMLLAFIATFVFTKPSVSGMAAGLVPVVPEGSLQLVIAFMASCFSIVGALYQSYLVQERKRLNPAVKQTGRETIPGMVILGILAAIVMVCGAAVLNTRNIEVTKATDMAVALEPIFGNFASALFLSGLFGASFSSVIGNAALGGTLLGDALGYGGTLQSGMVRFFIGIIMVIGAVVAISFGKLPLELIVLAQAVTIFVVPFIGVALYLIANDEKIMGPMKNPPFIKIVGAIGLVIMALLMISNIKTLFFS
ncbi:Nramp family divalent metal transporter [uncultured Chitinophaga sp.]|uniref:Nramp family divalent metal transporter n=1 Tax=uncultured Chitinophaga sp. TaxID=339340 RepID=UPI002621FFEE|nr:Nramp family divalent metal transporter [uncultured Chitinophaga sp.]